LSVSEFFGPKSAGRKTQLRLSDSEIFCAQATGRKTTLFLSFNGLCPKSTGQKFATFWIS